MNQKDLPVIYKGQVVGIGEVNNGEVVFTIWRDRYDVPQNDIKITIEYQQKHDHYRLITLNIPVAIYVENFIYD